MARRREHPARRRASRAERTVGLVSLGCAKNLVDSQILMETLLAAGFRPAPDPASADMVLVNTCAFIHDAREESIDAILEVCRLKQRGRCRHVIVAGCLVQRYRDELRAALPDVDAFVGLDNLDGIGAVARRLLAGERGVMDVAATATRLYEPRRTALSLTGAPHAYLKIAEGCNHRCGFCAIPAIRGRYRSRAIAAVVREAEALLAAGIRELNLISQDTTAYGRDRNDGASTIALLKALDALGGRFRIRLLYGYPSRVTAELLETMAAIPRVCRYLDVPIQHSHPDMLRAMGRADTIRAVTGLPGLARSIMPDIALRTTLLTGYPGESERHVAHLIAHLASAAYDHLGVFAFSPETGTRAAGLRPRPRAGTAQCRRERLLQAQEPIAARRRAAQIGVVTDVLIDATPGRRRIGRTARQAPDVDGVTVVARAPRHTVPGAILPVRITGVRGPDFEAVALADIPAANRGTPA